MGKQEKGKSLLRQMLEERGVRDISGVQGLVKELTASMIQEIMDAELEEELGYSKYNYQQKATNNSRNGSYPKSVESTMGTIDLHVPRDRKGEYEPQIVKKGQTDISDIEDKILYLYSKGTSTRDIEQTMRELYGIEVDATRVSRITDKLLPTIRAWQDRPLESVYAMVMLDAIHYKVREEGTVVKKAVYIAIGTDMEGMKEVLGLWIGATESAKYWMSVLTGLKNRGVRDILIASMDGLTGFSEAMGAVFPKTDIQRCIIHQIRASTKYVSYKDIKAFVAALKPIYQAVSEESALAAVDELEAQWGKKYPCAIQSWRAHWSELATMFQYPEQIRRIIYTTNAIENFKRQLRKVTKTKGAFVSDDALLKQLYLITVQVVQKWTMPIRDWGAILAQLTVYYGERATLTA